MKRWFIVFAIIVVATGIVGAVLYNVYDPTANTSQYDNRAIARQEAEAQARVYAPPEGTSCAQVVTPAVHDETGASFTFPSSCLAPGWSSAFDAPTESLEEANLSPPQDATQPRDYDQEPETTQPTPPPHDEEYAIEDSTRQRASRATERIIDKAKLFRPESSIRCQPTKTPAIHKATGARYNFPSSCLPWGWVEVHTTQD